MAYGAGLRMVGSASRKVSTRRPGPGMVEHDPDELLDGVLEAIAEVRRQLPGSVAALGIADQTESFLLWERDGGRASTPILSWQDQRAAGICDELAGRPQAASIAERTGLGLDPTFSAPKLAWLFGADPVLRRRAEAGELAFGDIACWLAWHLSGGAGHVTEPSNACRSLLVDLDSLEWDEGLLDLFGVPAAVLPEIRPSDGSALVTDGGPAGFAAPIAAMLGDQPAALYGQGCTEPGMAALTLGTGAFLWLNAGAERPRPPAGVLATAAWQRAGAGVTYALEAFCANAGNALGMLGDMGLAPAGSSAAPPDWAGPHPIVVPAPSGLGTPRWHGEDRITVLDASSATTRGDLAAAWLAGVAHQIADALEAAGGTGVIRVGGGLAAHDGLLQAVADLSGRSLEVAADLEATAQGIAALAAQSAGAGGGAGAATIARRVEPRLDDRGRSRERARWAAALDVHVQAQAEA